MYVLEHKQILHENIHNEVFPHKVEFGKRTEAVKRKNLNE